MATEMLLNKGDSKAVIDSLKQMSWCDYTTFNQYNREAAPNSNLY